MGGVNSPRPRLIAPKDLEMKQSEASEATKANNHYFPKEHFPGTHCSVSEQPYRVSGLAKILKLVRATAARSLVNATLDFVGKNILSGNGVLRGRQAAPQE